MIPASETPLPPTEALEPTATFTEVPTETEFPTNTPTFTATVPPTETPIPAPITYTDDFSKDNGNWENCLVCEWSNGMLWYGPMPASNSAAGYPTFCKACGTPTYFRMSADVQWFEGQTDRLFGLVFNDNDEESFAWGISTIQIYIVYHLEKQFNNIDYGQADWSGLAKPGTASNNLSVEVIPTNPGYGNIFLQLNGKNALILYNKPVQPGKVGLLLDMHTIGAAYDNFEFEEIWPEWEE